MISNLFKHFLNIAQEPGLFVVLYQSQIYIVQMSLFKKIDKFISILVLEGDFVQLNVVVFNHKLFLDSFLYNKLLYLKCRHCMYVYVHFFMSVDILYIIMRVCIVTYKTGSQQRIRLQRRLYVNYSVFFPTLTVPIIYTISLPNF